MGVSVFEKLNSFYGGHLVNISCVDKDCEQVETLKSYH